MRPLPSPTCMMRSLLLLLMGSFLGLPRYAAAQPAAPFAKGADVR